MGSAPAIEKNQELWVDSSVRGGWKEGERKVLILELLKPTGEVDAIKHANSNDFFHSSLLAKGRLALSVWAFGISGRSDCPCLTKLLCELVSCSAGMADQSGHRHSVIGKSSRSHH
jgi:hypothetical protein